MTHDNKRTAILMEAADLVNNQRALQLLNQDKRQKLTCPDPDRYDPENEAAELVVILQEAIAL